MSLLLWHFPFSDPSQIYWNGESAPSVPLYKYIFAPLPWAPSPGRIRLAGDGFIPDEIRSCRSRSPNGPADSAINLRYGLPPTWTWGTCTPCRHVINGVQITGQRRLRIDIRVSLAIADKHCFVLAHFQRACGTMRVEVKVDRGEFVFRCDIRSRVGMGSQINSSATFLTVFMSTLPIILLIRSVPYLNWTVCRLYLFFRDNCKCSGRSLY